MGVVTRVNAPYAAIRVLTGQQMSEVINVWLKKLQFVAKGFSLGISISYCSCSDLYNELEEEDMNISYNSLSECLNLVADQFTSITELFNPLVSRAKLLANPLFRSDVMTNDKLKKWGKGVIQKTKAMATLLSTPTEQDRSSSASAGFPQSPHLQSSDEDMMIAKPTSRGKSPPEISVTRRQSGSYGDPPSDDGKHANKGFFSRIFKSKKKDVSRERAPSPRGSVPSLLERDDSRDSLLGSPREDAFPSGSFDPFSERRSLDTSLYRRSSEGGRFACASPRVRRSHRHYRSFSDDVSGSQGLEEASRLWLNVNGGGSGGERRGGLREHYANVRSGLHSPPPAQGESESDDLLDMGAMAVERVRECGDGYEGYGGVHEGYGDIRKGYDGDDHEGYDNDHEGYSDDHEGYSDDHEGYSDDMHEGYTNNSHELYNDNSHERYSDIHELCHVHDDDPNSTLMNLGDFSHSDNHTVNDNLLDLSSIDVTQPCGVAPETIAAMTTLTDPISTMTTTNSIPTLTTTNPISPMTSPTNPIRIPDASVDAKVKKSRIARMERLLGRRTVPPFRRRVAFLPPLPLATAQNANERPRDGKQVRFFTNVICHEYRSY